MSTVRERWTRRPATTAAAKSRSAPRPALSAAALIVSLLAMLVAPPAALAHGPVNPAASSYLATVRHTPPELDAEVIDGDQRMWIEVVPALTVVVLDYRGAPYLRFSAAGVQINHNSSMYYLNQVPAQLVPSQISPSTPPDWVQVSSGHSYGWHDGRLHALAATALAPSTTYVGRWTIPLRIDGRPAVIAGGLTYAPDPSIVWFWPIVVALACVLAALRVRRSPLELRIARGLALAAIVAFVVAAVGEQLHGRPDISIGQVIVLALMLAFAGWALRGLALGRHGWFGFFLIALAALFEGATLIGVLLHGFVLIALPPFVARTAVAVCLAAGAALLPLILRLAERQTPATDAEAPDAGLDWEWETAWE
jgi:hypothetical protein